MPCVPPVPEGCVPQMWHAFSHRGKVLQRRPIGWCILRPGHRRARTVFCSTQNATIAQVREAYDAWVTTHHTEINYTQGRMVISGDNLMQVPNLGKRCRMLAYNAMKEFFP